MANKLSPQQLRAIENIQQFVRSVEHVKKLVTELEMNRAAKASILNGIFSSIGRTLSQLRQRALTSNVGTLADTAGSLGVIAGRGGTGLNMRVRALNEGVNSMLMQLDQAMKNARQAEKADSGTAES